ncbi:uncharacterized protein B0H64DRAFT_420171 [Chaetomium fimeti]|uniref:Uncharacterized protein n=1 Tax=Chaetomium fimeti TaxID=1854472 RepID=A0AAE0LP08_9PEZI|nr:hypothetical protein B0H64DRAFT_420171 [Chaetomium fimeti]
MSSSRSLLEQDIWSASRDKEEPVSPDRLALHHKRAQSLCRQNVIATRDPTAFIILTIHINLCIGTLANFLDDRPDLSDLFMLTEVGHGLDARNLETTATLQPDGSFDLHTPNDAAAKAMPPTTPESGIPRVAVVFARLIVRGEDHGIKPFLVWLCDSTHMFRGITSRALPMRLGTASKPLDHAITTFEHVRLSPNALLGSVSKPEDERLEFLQQLWRVAVGTLSLSIPGISGFKVGTYIAALYSRRRTVASPNGRGRVPILSFSTQQRPILDAWAYGIVLEPYARWTVKQFMDPRHSWPVRHGLATAFKTIMNRATRVLDDLAERCGWQGLFTHSQIGEMAMTFRGNYIAEGDTLVLCIRLASELLARKYELPAPRHPSTPLAQREQHRTADARDKIAELGGYEKRRGEPFNRHILPRCRPLVEAMGHRMAYEAARDAGVCPTALRLFELVCLAGDPGWRASSSSSSAGEGAGGAGAGAGAGAGPGRAFDDDLVRAYEEALPDMLRTVAESGDLGEYVTAPILEDGAWDAFVGQLPAFEYPRDGDGGYQPKL